MFKVSSWNINSVRLRIDLVLKFLIETQPDILCLQETKTQDQFFPKKAFEKAGYPYLYFTGMKSYNGVAIISKQPIAEFEIQHHCDKEDCRHIVVTHENGIKIHSIYIPAGGDIPDRDENEKFGHKLDFVDAIGNYFSNHKIATQSQILLGDFNIAPHENDVWSHKQMLKIVSHTPIEVEKLRAFQDVGGFVDTARYFAADEEKSYSWWSYRAKDWEKSNRGRRLDHIWVSPDLKTSLRNYTCLKEARGWAPKPSDHAPIICELL